MSLHPALDAPIRLLLVDDNPGDSRLLQEHLLSVQNYSFQIHAAERLDVAIRLLDTNPIDLVILDLSLPDSSGVQTLRRLLDREKAPPVIVLTGFSDEGVVIDALRIGAQDYLVKSQLTRPLLLKSILYTLERFRALGALRESEERYALAALASNDGLWDWNLLTDVVYYSQRWCQITGLSATEIKPTPNEWFGRVHPDDLPEVQQAIQHHLNGHSHHFEIEYRMRHRNGNYRWVLSRGVALFDSSKRAYRLAGSQSDVTARKHTEQRLIYEIQHDPLTRLPNRVHFRKQLHNALQRLRGETLARFAVLFLDLDRFKTINDSLGHLAGDQLLTAIARRLENCVPPDTTIARLGGDEFAILLDCISTPADALRVAKRILTALQHPFQVQQHEIYSTGCIGIALSNEVYSDPEDMLRDADTAMYRAKAAGSGEYQVFDTAMHTSAVALWRLESDLRRAIDRQEFSIHYQPIVFLSTGRLAGFEALVRWNHPERGLLFPGDFLSVAEQTGLLTSIDRWMILNGVTQLKKWQDQYPGSAALFLSLNLSDRLVNQHDLPGYMEEVISQTGVDPTTLKLEITETVISNEINQLRNTLSCLRDMGIRLCLDDFGTGYSSLGSLQYYEVDILKIAAPFVAAMTKESGGLEIVRTIITLANELALEVIAEGVETAHQYAMLEEMGCAYGQGRYFSQSTGWEMRMTSFDDDEVLFTDERIF